MWAILQKVMKLEKLAHFQSEVTILVKWSPWIAKKIRLVLYHLNYACGFILFGHIICLLAYVCNIFNHILDSALKRNSWLGTALLGFVSLWSKDNKNLFKNINNFEHFSAESPTGNQRYENMSDILFINLRKFIWIPKLSLYHKIFEIWYGQCHIGPFNNLNKKMKWICPWYTLHINGLLCGETCLSDWFTTLIESI